MGLLNFFSRKKKSSMTSSEKELFDKMTVLLFGGTDEFRKQTIDLHGILDKRYEAGKVANALTWMTSQFSDKGDKSEIGLVDEGQLCRPGNVFSRDDAVVIYRYVAEKSFQRRFPDAPHEMFEVMLQGFGNNPDGATTNVIPGAYGEYGYDLTNPIPARGVPSNEIYLQRLRLHSGEKFHWKRVGSFGAKNIKHPIDGYEIITESGENLCTLYLSPYQKIISTQAPKGFYLTGDDN